MNPLDATISNVLDRLIQHEQIQSAEQRPNGLHVTPSTGRFLELLIEEQQPTRILEISSCPGYATLWMARAALPGNATVDAVCPGPESLQIISQHLQECQLQSHVTLQPSTPVDFLQQAPPNHYDFIFLNADRSQYATWWTDILRISRRLLVVCNAAVAHTPDFQPLLQIVDHAPALERTLLTVGHGLLLIRHRSAETTAHEQVNGLPLLTPRFSG